MWSEHFTESDYNNNRRLKSDAVPSFFILQKVRSLVIFQTNFFSFQTNAKNYMVNAR